MNRQEIEKVVLASLGSVMKCEVDHDSSRENTMAWDSLKHIEVIFLVEEELEVQFSEDELEELNSVSAIVEKVLRQHAT